MECHKEVSARRVERQKRSLSLREYFIKFLPLKLTSCIALHFRGEARPSLFLKVTVFSWTLSREGQRRRKEIVRVFNIEHTDYQDMVFLAAIASELSSDAVIVLGNPLATGTNPFGTRRDKDLGLVSTVLMY